VTYRPSPSEVTESRLNRADTPPPGRSPQPGYLVETHLLAGSMLDEGDWSNMRMAAVRTRRMCNQHHCRGLDCRHRNHRRDVAYLAQMLNIIAPELPGTYPQVTDEDYLLPGMRGSGK